MSIDNLKTTLNAIKYLLTEYPKKKDIPSKLSQLENDSGFLTLDTLPKYEGVVE